MRWPPAPVRPPPSSGPGWNRRRRSTRTIRRPTSRSCRRISPPRPGARPRRRRTSGPRGRPCRACAMRRRPSGRRPVSSSGWRSWIRIARPIAWRPSRRWTGRSARKRPPSGSSGTSCRRRWHAFPPTTAPPVKRWQRRSRRWRACPRSRRRARKRRPPCGPAARRPRRSRARRNVFRSVPRPAARRRKTTRRSGLRSTRPPARRGSFGPRSSGSTRGAPSVQPRRTTPGCGSRRSGRRKRAARSA